MLPVKSVWVADCGRYQATTNRSFVIQATLLSPDWNFPLSFGGTSAITACAAGIFCVNAASAARLGTEPSIKFKANSPTAMRLHIGFPLQWPTPELRYTRATP